MKENSTEPDFAVLEVVATAFLHSLYQFLKLTETHDPKNKIFDDALAGLMRTIENFLKTSQASSIELTFRGEHIFINKTRLRPRTRQFYIYRFILKFMRYRRIGFFLIKENPTIAQFGNFLWLLASTKISDTVSEPALKIMETLQSSGVSIFEVRPISKLHMGAEKQDASDGSGLEDLELAAAATYEELRHFAEVAFDNLENAEKFNLRRSSELLNDLAILSEEDLVQMLRLLSVKRYERPLPYRATNAAFLMAAWAFSLRLPRGVTVELADLALMHPLSLSEKGEPQEFKTPADRVKLLLKLEKLKKVWPVTELQTLALLEWGRPYGDDGVYEMAGTKCYSHFFSRMLRIVADFEMMTTYMPGQRVFLPDEALSEFSRRPKIYDPTLLKLFVNWMGVYPVGSLVQLQTGEVAQVFAGSSDPTKFQRPLVMILKDQKGQLLERPQIFDLTEMNEKLGTYRKTIRKSLSAEEAGISPDHFKMTPVGF